MCVHVGEPASACVRFYRYMYVEALCVAHRAVSDIPYSECCVLECVCFGCLCVRHLLALLFRLRFDVTLLLWNAFIWKTIWYSDWMTDRMAHQIGKKWKKIRLTNYFHVMIGPNFSNSFQKLVVNVTSIAIRDNLHFQTFGENGMFSQS